MDEDIAAINTTTRNEKIKNFFINNKKNISNFNINNNFINYELFCVR